MNRPEPHPPTSRLELRQFLRVLRSLVLLAAAIAIMLWGIERLRRLGRADRCRMCLNRVAVALRFFHIQFNRLPPPYLTDNSGRPMHSWRIIVMPLLVNGKPYDFGVDEYNYNEPWNSPNNTQFRNGHAYYDYACPIYAKASRNASYLCVVGGVIWPLPKRTGTFLPDWPYTTEGGVLPGQGKAILLVELTESDIPWTKPTDIGLSELALLLRDDPSGDRFRHRIRHVVIVDAAGTPFILDPLGDIEEIKKVVESEAAGKTARDNEDGSLKLQSENTYLDRTATAAR